jgi:pimeloyl-ACP methyl ester carboxylesterase
LNPVHPLPPPATLPDALRSERLELVTVAGRISYYRAGPQAVSAPGLPSPQFAPLLLVHSINASGSAAEVAPLFDHYRATRPVYALDMPGFGFSSRTARAYTPRVMTDAVLALIDQMRADHGCAAVDVLALSLASEYAARAQCEAPGSIRRLALVSPTGFSRAKRRYGPPGSTLGLPWLYKVFTWPVWSDGIYRNLTRPGVIRYFLERTWGSKTIDEQLWRYDLLTTRQPGAKHAPFYFVSAYLFSNDINTLYEAIDCPVWVSMATRGDFTDYQGRTTVAGRPNWQFHAVEGGALPYFEDLKAFSALLDPFLDTF